MCHGDLRVYGTKRPLLDEAYDSSVLLLGRHEAREFLEPVLDQDDLGRGIPVGGRPYRRSVHEEPLPVWIQVVQPRPARKSREVSGEYSFLTAHRERVAPWLLERPSCRQ